MNPDLVEPRNDAVFVTVRELLLLLGCTIGGKGWERASLNKRESKKLFTSIQRIFNTTPSMSELKIDLLLTLTLLDHSILLKSCALFA